MLAPSDDGLSIAQAPSAAIFGNIVGVAALAEYVLLGGLAWVAGERPEQGDGLLLQLVQVIGGLLPVGPGPPLPTQKCPHRGVQEPYFGSPVRLDQGWADVQDDRIPGLIDGSA